MKALILVDIQNDFLPGGALAVPAGDEVIPVANQRVPAYELVVATQDWHPRDHLSFASQHDGKQFGDAITLSGIRQVLWPDHCIQGTHGAEFAGDLNLAGIHHCVRKGTDRAVDSYSGFFDNGRLRSTGLAEFLREQNVEEVDIMGLATDYCVKFTALDARRLGFRTRLILDGVRGVELNAGDVAAAMNHMKENGIEIL